jgi:nucleoside phosphorylase
MPNVLIVAATERELNGRDGLVCGIGPVEAAAATARALALREWGAVLHVGIAGGRGLAAGSLAIGAEAVYCDLDAMIRRVDRVAADPRLVEAARKALPRAPVVSIGTSAAVEGSGHCFPVEAMEGFAVLRAAALAGVPAIEVRAVSNEVGEQDRSLWLVDDALGALEAALPALLAEIEAALDLAVT